MAFKATRGRGGKMCGGVLPFHKARKDNLSKISNLRRVKTARVREVVKLWCVGVQPATCHTYPDLSMVRLRAPLLRSGTPTYYPRCRDVLAPTQQKQPPTCPTSGFLPCSPCPTSGFLPCSPTSPRLKYYPHYPKQQENQCLTTHFISHLLRLHLTATPLSEFAHQKLPYVGRKVLWLAHTTLSPQKLSWKCPYPPSIFTFWRYMSNRLIVLPPSFSYKKEINILYYIIKKL